jgi:hypothetical protein
MGFTKPGARTSDIIKTVEDEIVTFSSKDFLILWAGANDISKNNTKGALKSLTKCIKVYKRADHLCGLVVRVLGYRSGGPGSIPGTTKEKKK